MSAGPNAAGNKSKPPAYVPGVPEPTCRAELLKYWIDLSCDEKTANKMLWISEGGSKVTRRTEEICPVLDRPERYEYSPQVLCKEGIWQARGYWEVECGGWVAVGASYEGAGRRANAGPSGLGENQDSWGLCWGISSYQVWYDGMYKDLRDLAFSSTLGMYVDQPAGLICFYAVHGEGPDRQTTLLHRVQGALHHKILPGIWVGIQSTAVLLKKTE
ncbi:Stonustoxin subunit beta [Merluccius polli]|uniref:Stonustoxin subunit beta n=1 Tax=Merluccius polli TaxID=89951 RepID=A0AA47MDE1_MERPO|nr:Stonustoxin subunit beta [Merluccius polli]